ncbi:MAG: hypothetical protein CVV42_20695 [Candidatus Riflebacteria bacterium HGW-Riflebacteria-2]|nr:MAG: hypothetical protein CVV42_20695 [Candidatus Riflebacteria bacterium HGW-Riflebacteria-2]
MLSEVFTLMGLREQVKDANKRWVDERRNSYFVHLRDKLARPLFLDQLLNIAEDLQPEIIGRCETACNELKEISAKNGTL